MLDFFRRLFFSSDFMPHGHCYLWRPEILWLHVISDGLIALAYFSIPVALFYFVRQRRSMAFDWMFVMFGLFICACGTTHVLDVVTVWRPVYRLAGLAKAFTAVASLMTAVALWKLVPRMLAMPSPRQLQASNRQLAREVANRKAVEEELRHSHSELEERVEQRTVELKTEVAARQQAEEEVRASQQQLKNIIDFAPLSIFLKDRAGHYLQANRTFASTYGFTGDEMLGKTSADLFPAETVAMVDEHSEQVFATGEAQEFEEIVVREDGLHTFLSMRFLLPGLNGTPDTLGVISRDVTERKRAEQDIQQAREEAERANRAKSEFLSRMSHELRTPLNAILGFGQLLEMSAQSSRQRENVSHILKGGNHLLGLINEVLDIARIESGRLELTLESVNACHVLNEAADLIQPQAAGRKVRVVRCTCNGRGKMVRADRQRLSQIALNLLSNAVKYNRTEGTVSISCEVIEQKAVVHLAVSDTGYGIAPTHLNKLFTPFERLGAEHGNIEGTGIGLALSKRLAEAMGGTIGVDSIVDRGSTFWVEFPSAEEEVPITDEAKPLQTSAKEALDARPTVLYIEDNLSNFALVEQALEVMRPETRLLAAMQGRLGLDMAAEHCPDLILLDLQLPDIPGDELLRRLRTDEKTREIPVVMISADATHGQVERLLALGARAYLTKPLNIQEFVHAFDEALAQTPT